jgi:hypothetical protein
MRCCLFPWGGGYCCSGSLYGVGTILGVAVLVGELRGLSAGNYSPAYRSISGGSLPVPKNESQNWQEQNRDFKKIFRSIFGSKGKGKVKAPYEVPPLVILTSG